MKLSVTDALIVALTIVVVIVLLMNSRGKGDSGYHLYGSADNDVLTGDAGDNYLWGGAGADVLAGGPGLDTLDYRGSDQRVVVNLASRLAAGGMPRAMSFPKWKTSGARTSMMCSPVMPAATRLWGMWAQMFWMAALALTSCVAEWALTTCAAAGAMTLWQGTRVKTLWMAARVLTHWTTAARTQGWR